MAADYAVSYTDGKHQNRGNGEVGFRSVHDVSFFVTLNLFQHDEEGWPLPTLKPTS
jgi:hypothetical protein